MFKKKFLEYTKDIPIETKRVIPNMVSQSRFAVAGILIAVSLIAVLYKEFNISVYILIGLSIYAGVSDYVDGFVARAWKVISPRGKRLDEVADKIVFLCFCLSFWIFNYFRFGVVFELWYILLIFIGIRDFLVTCLRNNFEKFKKKLSKREKKKIRPIAVHPLAKIKTVMIFLGAICFYIYHISAHIEYVSTILYVIVYILFISALVSAIISMLTYDARLRGEHGIKYFV